MDITLSSYEPKIPWVLNPESRLRALDIQRLVDKGVLCRSKFARLFSSISTKTGECFDINCKSWRCVKHRRKWGWKWHNILQKRLEEMPITLLVNLTTSEMVDHEIVHKAMRRFWWLFRQEFGPTEYLRVTEYNKDHTQPHFHCLVSCPDLKFPEMPARFRSKEAKNLSYPDRVYTWIMQTWGDCLEYFAPRMRRTSVVWCQPPGNGVAAGKYAVNYITGKNAKAKNEEPDGTWRGRKLCYSKGFFDIPAAQIYHALLIEKFGEPDPDDKFFWLPNDSERISGEHTIQFSGVDFMKKAYAQAQFYRKNGHWPVEIELEIYVDDEEWSFQLVNVQFSIEPETGQKFFFTST